jgi:ABC-type sugar transport system ATPase subunit
VAATNRDVVLKIDGLNKNFDGVRVLRDVGFSLRKGMVLGVVGENGAGKSTLLNVLGGVYQRTSGEIELFGEKYRPREPMDATRAGIAFIHQELNLFTNLTVAENIFVDEGIRGRMFLPPKLLDRKAKTILDALAIDLDPAARVEDLTMGMRQMVEIAKAVSKDAKIIFFDEPTTSLSTSEKETLFKLIRDFAAKGISMIYISHALDDVFMLCDEVLVIRDGETVGGQVRSGAITKDEAINRMVGRKIGQIYPYVEKTVGEVLLDVKGIVRSGVLDGVSIAVRSGEIVGLFGLMGAGRTELARAIYGVDPFDSGRIEFKGRAIADPDPMLWVREKVAFITENRRDEGLLLPKTVVDNISLVNLPHMRKRLAVLDRAGQSAAAAETVSKLRIKTGDANRQIVRNLSGGNQQKVVIGKWLLIRPDLFILDEPTRGVDVGSKFDIYTYINALAASGTGVLFISSEMEELVGVCDRIAVMCGGRIAGELERAQFSSEALLKLALEK